MNTTAIPKKVWSPNSPFGRDNSVFSMKTAQSLCRGGKARMVSPADAMASITGRLEPARWTDTFLRARFIKLGMPKRGVDTLILVFQGKFSETVMRVMAEEAEERAADRAYDNKVDNQRGGNAVAVWKNRPTMACKTPGGPNMNSQQCLLRTRKKER